MVRSLGLNFYELRVDLKHLAGQHDQATHANRYHHIDGMRVLRTSGKKPKLYSEKGDVEAAMKNSSVLQECIKDDNLPYPSGRQDTFLQMILHEQGFDGKPRLVSKEELEKEIGEGAVEMYRGEKEASYVEDFKQGAFYTGTGIFGSGSYAAYAKGSDRVALGYAGGEPKQVMRMALSKEARVISVAELSDYAFEQEKKIRETMMPHVEEAKKTGDWSEAARYNTLHQVTLNRGRLAASLGYDAILIDKSGDSVMQYVLVLNRGKVLVQE